MVLDPVNSAVDRVRLKIADFQSPPILDNATIQYYLDKNGGKENPAIKECGFVILGLLARDSSYRKIDVLIEDGRYAYNSYKDYLLQLVKNPSLGLTVGGYFGGVSIADMIANDENGDNNTRPHFSPLAPNVVFEYGKL